MLCLEPATERNVELLQFIALADPKTLTMSAECSGDINSLHLVCKFGVATVKLLQFLVQVDSSMLRKKCCYEGGYPLGMLSRRAGINGFSENEANLKCLLDADSSADVVVDAARQCYLGALHYYPFVDNVIPTLKLLMTANPAAIAHRDPATGKNLVHFAIESLQKVPNGLKVIEFLISLRTEALQEADRNGNLPAHEAARGGNDAILEAVLKLYPQAATVVNGMSQNLLHCALHSRDGQSLAESISSRYPQMATQRDSKGWTPLLHALYSCDRMAFFFSGAWVRDAAAAEVMHPTDENYHFNGYLPLHFAVEYYNSRAVEVLLRLYPEAAGIEGGRGEYRGTPYSIAPRDRPSGYERQLLRAAPHVDPAALRDLNWAARRMAMFLAFRAVSRRAAPNMLARLRFENKDLVKHVVSFL